MSVKIRDLGLTALAGLVIALAACTSAADEATEQAADEFVLAFQVTDDRRAFVERTEPLAEWISARTGTPARVLTVQDDRAQITALATGQAHAAYMSGGPAWVGWQEFGLEVLAAEVREADGRMSYVAGLWVLRDSGIERIEDLRGSRSCHTGEFTGAGMFVPIGYLVRHGYVDTGGIDMNDIGALPELRGRFFGASRIGGGYLGSFQCLSLGEGDVATGRDTAWDDFCDGDPEPWCRPRDDYRFLPEANGPDPAESEGGLARIPSHPVMVSPRLPEADRDALAEAFLALGDDPEGERILEEILGVGGLVPATAEEHLGPYGEVLAHVPGITDHLIGASGSVER